MISPALRSTISELRYHRWLVLECGKLLDDAVKLIQQADCRDIDLGHQQAWEIEQMYNELEVEINKVKEECKR